jgi:DNA topoisomerase-1
MHRITFNEITKSAILEAIEHKKEIDEHLVEAQQARRVLDRWVGYEVSPILWRKIAKGLSAGRVQSVALMLIDKRHTEVITFKQEEYWSFHGIFAVNSKSTLLAELIKIGTQKVTIVSKEEADKVVDGIKKETFAVEKITEKQRLRNPLPPFMTSTLQQDAFNKLGFAVERTMSLAQKLYEGVPLGDPNKPEALITYMRTDSLRISETALTATRSFIQKEYGKEYLPKDPNTYDKKGAQDAHEAIRPIDVSMTPDAIGHYLPRELAKLYELIWKRFVASQMQPAEYFLRQVEIKGGKFLFRATGSTLMFDGFLRVYLVEDEEDEKSVKIPKEIKEKDSLPLNKLDPKQHFTQPPPYYTEATLVKELEKLGIGRPSTYATILSTIQKRHYVEKKDKKRFFPTELGIKVNELLTKNLPDIINVSFTATMEESLDKIAQGDIKRDKVLNDFYGKFKKDVIAFGGKDIGKKAMEIEMKCPQCGKPLMLRFGKTGQFVGCSGFPDCAFTSNFARNEQGAIELVEAEKPAEIDLTCPQCGKKLVQKRGKFGMFIACPGYPECKYIHQEALKTPCPSCGGKLTKRKWRGGSFWGCSGYPKCNFAVFGQAVEQACPKCKCPLMSSQTGKDGKTIVSCPQKACGYKSEGE